MKFCCDSCKETEELSTDLCPWYCNDRWLGPPTERIPSQPLPDLENPVNGDRRTLDDYLPRKCLKDLKINLAVKETRTASKLYKSSPSTI